MASVEQYSAIVRSIIEAHAALKPSYGEVETETIFDDAKGHYELTYTGWHGNHRIHGSVLHVDLRGGKVWVQHDGTSPGIADELLAAGVPPEHIVLAFKHPRLRALTGLASG